MICKNKNTRFRRTPWEYSYLPGIWSSFYSLLPCWPVPRLLRFLSRLCCYTLPLLYRYTIILLFRNVVLSYFIYICFLPMPCISYACNHSVSGWWLQSAVIESIRKKRENVNHISRKRLMKICVLPFLFSIICQMMVRQSRPSLLSRKNISRR